MTGDKKLLSNYEDIIGSYVSFAGPKGGNISGQGDVVNGKITQEKVNYVEQLSHNLMSVSQICDKGNLLSPNDECKFNDDKSDL